MAQLWCKDVVLGYEGKAVVQNLNFEVNKGDYLCIVGENGSGKSTLMKALLQLKKPMGCIAPESATNDYRFDCYLWQI